MSGKRLLDAAGVFAASRNVASKALGLRSSQFLEYGKTYSITRYLDSRRPGPKNEQHFAPNAGRAASVPPSHQFTPSRNGKNHFDKAETGQSNGASNASPQTEGLRQDHFYEASGTHSVSDPVPNQSLSLLQKQARQKPLPDGTIPPPQGPITAQTSSGAGLEAEKARKLQHEAEKHLPSQTAEPPTQSHETDPELSVDQEQDVFSERPREIGQSLSALPRVKIPKNSATRQEGGEAGSDHDINPDVFNYTAPAHAEAHEQKAEPANVFPEQELSEETFTKLFQSPKTASKLRAPARQIKNTSVETSEFEASGDRETADLHDLASALNDDVKTEV